MPDRTQLVGGYLWRFSWTYIPLRHRSCRQLIGGYHRRVVPHPVWDNQMASLIWRWGAFNLDLRRRRAHL
jgi:hypothetical protein